MPPDFRTPRAARGSLPFDSELAEPEARHLRRFPRTASGRTLRRAGRGRVRRKQFHAAPAESPVAESASRNFPARRNPNATVAPSRTAQPEQRRPEPPRPKPWIKPADFRPAETSAISQAVAHATEIAESLKQRLTNSTRFLNSWKSPSVRRSPTSARLTNCAARSAASSRRAISRPRAARAMTNHIAATRSKPRAAKSRAGLTRSRQNNLRGARNRHVRRKLKSRPPTLTETISAP